MLLLKKRYRHCTGTLNLHLYCIWVLTIKIRSRAPAGRPRPNAGRSAYTCVHNCMKSRILYFKINYLRPDCTPSGRLRCSRTLHKLESCAEHAWPCLERMDLATVFVRCSNHFILVEPNTHTLKRSKYASNGRSHRNMLKNSNSLKNLRSIKNLFLGH